MNCHWSSMLGTMDPHIMILGTDATTMCCCKYWYQIIFLNNTRAWQHLWWPTKINYWVPTTFMKYCIGLQRDLVHLYTLFEQSRQMKCGKHIFWTRKERQKNNHLLFHCLPWMAPTYLTIFSNLLLVLQEVARKQVYQRTSGVRDETLWRWLELKITKC